VEIVSETKEGIAILTLSGRLKFDESLLSLRQHVGNLLAAGIKRFVMDFSRVPHCDSSGCGEVISAYATVRKAGGAVAFTKPGERVRLLWERIKLTDVFPIFDSVPEAEAFLRSESGN
jgi:anti-anti-sigma factor